MAFNGSDATPTLLMTALPAHGEPSDEDLTELARRGDAVAVEALYERYGTGLLRLAYRLTASLDDAEDVIQDVFVGLPLALNHYVERGRLEAWLRRLTTRTALMLIRQRTRRREETMDGAEAIMLPPVDPAARVDLETAINRLSPVLRTVFVLHKLADYSHSEIAAMLGIRRGTSEVRFHRAVRRLQEMLRADR